TLIDYVRTSCWNGAGFVAVVPNATHDWYHYLRSTPTITSFFPLPRRPCAAGNLPYSDTRDADIFSNLNTTTAAGLWAYVNGSSPVVYGSPTPYQQTPATDSHGFPSISSDWLVAEATSS